MRVLRFAQDDGTLYDGTLNDGTLNDGTLNDGTLSDGALSGMIGLSMTHSSDS
jgi:hypothetical protein